MKQAFLWALLVGFLLIVGTCEYENRQSSLATSSRQMELFNSQLDTLQEEIAASRSPGGFALLALVLSVAVPIVLGVILLGRSERSAIHSDEIIRQLARHGLTSKLIEAEKLLGTRQTESRQKILKFPSLKQRRGLPGPKRFLPDEDDEDDLPFVLDCSRSSFTSPPLRRLWSLRPPPPCCTEIPRPGTWPWRSCHFSRQGDQAMVMLRSEDDLSLSIRRGFVRILSDLRRLLACSFRYEKAEQRSESVSEAIAFAFAMYKSAREAGKQVDARPLAHYAALRVKSGARFCGTHRLDATNSQTLQGRRPIDCRSLAQTPETLIADRKGHWPVSDQVAFRMDWMAFTNRCSRKDRFIMGRLAAGYRRNEVAQELDVTPPAITLRMNQVRHRWQVFQA